MSAASVDFGQESLASLRQQMQGKGVIPFIGAGLSVNFGVLASDSKAYFQTWNAFLLAQATLCGALEEITDSLRLGDYEQAAQIIFERNHTFVDNVKSSFGVLPDIINYDATVFSLPSLWKRSPVVTTNFDPVLEYVYRTAGETFEWSSYSVEGRSLVQGLAYREHFLLKLHGHATFDSSRVLTRTEYQRHYGESGGPRGGKIPPLLEALQYLFSTESVLFLGCGLNKDRYLEVLRATGSKINHFAVVPQGEDFQKVAERLAYYNIRPIWYPRGDYRCVKAILGYLRTGIRPISGTLFTLTVTLREGDEFNVLAYLSRHRENLPSLRDTFLSTLLDRSENHLPKLILRLTSGDLELHSWPHLKGPRSSGPLKSISLIALMNATSFDFDVRGALPMTLQLIPGTQPRIILLADGSKESMLIEVRTHRGPTVNLEFEGVTITPEE